MNAVYRAVAAGSLTLFAGLATAAPVISHVGNLLGNGHFETGLASPVSTGVGVGALSALGSWNQYSNSSGITSTWATSPLIEGTHLAKLSGGLNDGLYQYMGLGGGAPTRCRAGSTSSQARIGDPTPLPQVSRVLRIVTERCQQSSGGNFMLMKPENRARITSEVLPMAHRVAEEAALATHGTSVPDEARADPRPAVLTTPMTATPSEPAARNCRLAPPSMSALGREPPDRPCVGDRPVAAV